MFQPAGTSEGSTRQRIKRPKAEARGRRILRIALLLVVLFFLWTRGKQWHDSAGLWLAGSITLTLILVMALVVEVSGVQQKWKRMRDEVPKKPLGLDT
jgi:hypothetical protein